MRCRQRWERMAQPPAPEPASTVLSSGPWPLVWLWPACSATSSKLAMADSLLDSDSLFRRADEALCRAKVSGKGRVAMAVG